MQFQRPDLDEFFRTYAITGFALDAHDERVLLSTNFSGHYNLWGMDLKHNYPYQLTHADQAPSQILVDPQGQFILLAMDRNGNEKNQIYAISPAGGTLQPILSAPDKTYFLAHLSLDGQRIYYTSDRDNPQFLSIYRYDLGSEQETLLHEGTETTTALVDVSPDEKSFVYIKHYANTFQVPFVVTPDGTCCLTPDPRQDQNTFDAKFVDDETVAFTTNYGANDGYLATYHIPSGRFQKWADAAQTELTGITVHRQSGTVYVVGTWGVNDRLYRIRVQSSQLERMSLPISVIQQMECSDSGSLFLLGRSDVQPLNIYRLQGEDWLPLTNNRVMGTTPEQLVQSEVLHFASFDGLEIEALWYAAPKEVANGYTIVWPHGGPQAAERQMYRPFFQFALSRGYNIWAPNFRGSTGYGAEFAKMVEGDWGEGPRLDMIASVDWLIASGRAQDKKIFVVGGSYGGYMTLLLHGRHADRFEAFVDIFGPSSLIAFYESVPDHWKPSMARWVGDPSQPGERERMERESPITYLEHMTKPMLVIQGANDPRVVLGESDRIVEALRSRGVDVEYIVLEDEGHGFQKKDNEILVYKRIVEFLDANRLDPS